jgi:hypothetical protein
MLCHRYKVYCGDLAQAQCDSRKERSNYGVRKTSARALDPSLVRLFGSSDSSSMALALR